MDQKGKEGRADAFRAALARDDPSALRVLLEQGLNPASSFEGLPLTALAAMGSPKCLGLLLERGAPTSLVLDDGPAFSAVFYDRVECLDVLLRHGLDLRERNESGETPLHMALRLGSLKVAQRLMGLAPDWSALDRDEWTPMDSAMAAPLERRLEILELFAREGAPLERAALAACRAGDAGSLAFVLEREVDIDASRCRQAALDGGRGALVAMLDERELRGACSQAPTGRRLRV